MRILCIKDKTIYKENTFILKRKGERIKSRRKDQKD